MYLNGDTDMTFLADIGTLSLTFKYLTFLTRDPKYWNSVMKISNWLFSLKDQDSILPFQVHVTKKYLFGEKTIGAGADSYYEYIAKQYIQTGRIETGFTIHWKKFMNAIRKSLRMSGKNQFLYVYDGNSYTQHLECFLGGTIAIYALQGSKNLNSTRLTLSQLQDIDLAEELGRSCYELYHQTATKLSPESVQWRFTQDKSEALDFHRKPLDNDGSLHDYKDFNGTVSRLPPIETQTFGDFIIQSSQYNQRPETLETLFYLYRITGKQEYRDMSWNIFLAYETFLKIESGGYAGLVVRLY